MAPWTIYDEVDRESAADYLDHDFRRLSWGYDPMAEPARDDDPGEYVVCLACRGEFLEGLGCDCWEPSE